MRVVIVGAGAVGQTYGFMLAASGAQVTFLVRPRYVDAMKDGVWVYPEAKGPVRWTDYDLTTEPIPCDQVWFCVSSTALPHCPLDWPGALGVFLQPGLHDRELMRQHFSEHRDLTFDLFHQSPLWAGEDCSVCMHEFSSPWPTRDAHSRAPPRRWHCPHAVCRDCDAEVQHAANTKCPLCRAHRRVHMHP